MPERADDSPRWILRRAVKVAVAGALHAAGANHAVRALRRREAGGVRVLVMSYHRATTDFAASAREGLPSLLVSARTLRRQIEQVARTHDVVSLSDAARILSEPRGTAGTDVAVITFDDGYADNHAVALPVLSALRAPATVFVATGFTGTERRMAHDRIFAALGELARHGVSPDRAGLEPPAQALLGACAEPGPAATLDRLLARLAPARLGRAARPRGRGRRDRRPHREPRGAREPADRRGAPRGGRLPRPARRAARAAAAPLRIPERLPHARRAPPRRGRGLPHRRDHGGPREPARRGAARGAAQGAVGELDARAHGLQPDARAVELR